LDEEHPEIIELNWSRWRAPPIATQFQYNHKNT